MTNPALAAIPFPWFWLFAACAAWSIALVAFL